MAGFNVHGYLQLIYRDHESTVQTGNCDNATNMTQRYNSDISNKR